MIPALPGVKPSSVKQLEAPFLLFLSRFLSPCLAFPSPFPPRYYHHHDCNQCHHHHHHHHRHHQHHHHHRFKRFTHQGLPCYVAKYLNISSYAPRAIIRYFEKGSTRYLFQIHIRYFLFGCYKCWDEISKVALRGTLQVNLRTFMALQPNIWEI